MNSTGGKESLCSKLAFFFFLGLPKMAARVLISSDRNIYRDTYLAPPSFIYKTYRSPLGFAFCCTGVSQYVVSTCAQRKKAHLPSLSAGCRLKLPALAFDLSARRSKIRHGSPREELLLRKRERLLLLLLASRMKPFSEKVTLYGIVEYSEMA